MERVLYDSVDSLIAAETLHQLTGSRVSSVRCTPMDGGLSGSGLLRVETDGDQPQRFVLKRMVMQSDWIMQASDDHACRSVALWQHGLLDQLQPTVDCTILACARDEDGWAMLMRDVSSNLMGQEAWSAAEIKFLLNTLVTMHVTFWEAPGLKNPAVGLCDTAGIITIGSVPKAHRFSSGTSLLPTIIIEGWELLQDWLEPNTISILADLIADPKPLEQALARYPATLVHGDYRDANLGLKPAPDPQTIMLDWQLAGRSIATVDLIFFLTKPQVLLSSISLEAGVDYYRQKLEQRLGNRFDPAQWQPMLELGWLVDTLRIAAHNAWWAVHGDREEFCALDRALLRQTDAQVRAALRWL